MKKTRKIKEKEVNEAVPEEKKSKIRLYWESMNGEKGIIVNMRQVMK
jgi:hypothetical protein